MTLLFFDGFDQGVAVQKPEWDTALFFTAATGRTTGGVAGTLGANQSKTLTLPTAAATVVTGFGWNPGTSAAVFGGNANAVLGICSSGSTRQLSFTIDVNGFLQLRKGASTGTIIATATQLGFSLNTFRYIEVKATLHATAGSCIVRVDGVEVINFSGSTSAVTGSVTQLQVASLNAAGGGGTAWDDMYVCDTVDATATQGRPNSDFLGDMKVVTLLPTAAGASTQWTPSTGANYAAVDEPTANTTDYVSSVAASGLRDLYDVGDLATNTAGVFGLRVGAYGQKTDTGAASVKPLIREGGGTIVAQSAQPLGTTWSGIYGPVVYKKSDSTLFTPADVNALQVGIESA